MLQAWFVVLSSFQLYSAQIIAASKPSEQFARRHALHLCKNRFGFYTQIKKTEYTENIPGMCVLTNHMRDLVTAENEWVLSHGIELFRKTTRFNLHQFILQKLEVLFLSI